MNIEIACDKNDTNKNKGDLLEKISKDLLEALGYDVISEIRFTGAELDLLDEAATRKKKKTTLVIKILHNH